MTSLVVRPSRGLANFDSYTASFFCFFLKKQQLRERSEKSKIIYWSRHGTDTETEKNFRRFLPTLVTCHSLMASHKNKNKLTGMSAVVLVVGLTNKYSQTDGGVVGRCGESRSHHKDLIFLFGSCASSAVAQLKRTNITSYSAVF